jgi:hypothetical protein
MPGEEYVRRCSRLLLSKMPPASPHLQTYRNLPAAYTGRAKLLSRQWLDEMHMLVLNDVARELPISAGYDAFSSRRSDMFLNSIRTPVLPHVASEQNKKSPPPPPPPPPSPPPPPPSVLDIARACDFLLLPLQTRGRSLGGSQVQVRVNVRVRLSAFSRAAALSEERRARLLPSLRPQFWRFARCSFGHF